jgi:citronellol/citronellal dehydrogenase
VAFRSVIPPACSDALHAPAMKGKDAAHTGEAGMSLKGKTVFISGGSRGIGLAIALRAARDGANVTIAAKTAEPHPKLPGTIYTAAEEIGKAGGKALPMLCDIREEAQVAEAVAKTVETFGGVDICVNNASAIQLAGTLETDMKRYDLMNQINARGTFLVSKLCIPHLKLAQNPHILNLAPPLDMKAKWFKNHVAYTMAKFGMSMCTLGMSAEFAGDGIAVNSLWPITAIDTAAVRNLLGGSSVASMSRSPDIVADAAYVIFNRPSREATGNFYIDEEVLRAEGVSDFSKYAPGAAGPLAGDFFVPDDVFERTDTKVTGLF